MKFSLILLGFFFCILATSRVFSAPPVNSIPQLFNETEKKASEQKKTQKNSGEECPWPLLKKIHDKILGTKENRDNGEIFWAEKEKGWFFEEERPSRKDKCQLKTLSFLTPSLLRSLPAPTFRKLLDDLMNYAVTNPTPENVEAYMLAQWIAREKAEKFMMAWSDVLRAHPVLDYTVVRAPFAYATKEQTLHLLGSREKFIKQAAARDEIALVAFVSPDCVYCVSQMPIILDLRKDYGIRVAFVNLKEHPEMIRKFGIEALPEVWLAVKGYGMARITAGLHTADDILAGIVKVYEDLTGKKVTPDIYRYVGRPDDIRPGTFEKPIREVSPWKENIPLY